MPQKIPLSVRSMIDRNPKSKSDHPQGNASRFCITPEKPTVFSHNLIHTGYDAASSLTQLLNFKSTGAVVSSFDYRYDNTGNRIGVTEASNDRVTWSYDNSTPISAAILPMTSFAF